MPDTDLTNCDFEPIHIPGRVQDFGFMIAIDTDFLITHCSENIERFLETRAEFLLGKSITALEDLIKNTGAVSFVNQLIKTGMSLKGFAPQNPYSVSIQQKQFNLILSHSNDFFLLEFEPEVSDLKKDLQQLLGGSISEMLSNTDLAVMLNNTARQIKSIIGYDRVMIYKFHQDGHGEVVAEEKNPDLMPWLGLHYPASDIPRQARELYKLNYIRLISNVHKADSAILSTIDPQIKPLDLTHVGLRAVSPIHIQYLKNMGVDSSFSISLMNDNELWGLVACHCYTPRFINYKERQAAKLIGQVLSSALSFRKNKEDEQRKYNLKLKVDELIKQLLRDDDLEEALCDHEITLLNAVEATGAVLAYNNQLRFIGNTPGQEFVQNLIEWIEQKTGNILFYTDHLPQDFPPAMSEIAFASGVLACRLNPELKEYLIWFRSEVITLVNWAGNQDNAGTATFHRMKSISPRTSFESWIEAVRMTSNAWKDEDIQSAIILREEVNFSIIKKATTLRILNDKLKAAYDELDTFSYTISHDLKNPLSSIRGYAQLLAGNRHLEEADKKFMIERILTSTEKMQTMITDVLDYSKMGQARNEISMLDMNTMLNEIKQELLIGAAHPELRIDILDTPSFFGDHTMIMQVFSNLMGNAVKYSLRNEHPLIVINGEKWEQGFRYCVSDNGIGIHPDEIEKIFDLFSRSERVGDFEGSGVGLAIVKKIVEKHQGKIWVESELNTGSSFYVFFHN